MATIVGASLIFMLLPALLIALIAEVVLGGGVRPKTFLGLGAIAGAILGSGVSAVSTQYALAFVFWPLLGSVAGASGAYSMLRLQAQESVNKRL